MKTTDISNIVIKHEPCWLTQCYQYLHSNEPLNSQHLGLWEKNFFFRGILDTWAVFFFFFISIFHKKRRAVLYTRITHSTKFKPEIHSTSHLKSVSRMQVKYRIYWARFKFKDNVWRKKIPLQVSSNQGTTWQDQRMALVGSQFWKTSKTGRWNYQTTAPDQVL